jgi:hypothetical protein
MFDVSDFGPVSEVWNVVMQNMSGGAGKTLHHCEIDTPPDRDPSWDLPKIPC